MRVVGGEFSGRSIQSPKGSTTRPTTDRMRESLFNILQHRFHIDFSGKRILDIYAGTGALGLEALSRGAEYCCFVENNTEALAALKTNLSTMQLRAKASVLFQDASVNFTDALSGVFDIVFLDPPYGKGLGENSLQLLGQSDRLTADSLIVLEEDTQMVIPSVFGLMQIYKKSMGRSQLMFFETVST